MYDLYVKTCLTIIQRPSAKGGNFYKITTSTAMSLKSSPPFCCTKYRLSCINDLLFSFEIVITNGKLEDSSLEKTRLHSSQDL